MWGGYFQLNILSHEVGDPVGHRPGIKGMGGRPSCHLRLAIICTVLSKPVSREDLIIEWDKKKIQFEWIFDVSAAGLEPTTNGLKGHCSTIEYAPDCIAHIYGG